METFNFKNIKVEKANAVVRHKRLLRVATLIRVMEICIFLVIISRFSAQFSFVSKLSGEYFRELSLTLISPRFVFVLGNAIVLVLLLKSGQSSKDTSSSNTITDFHDEYLKNCVKNYSEQSIKQGKQRINIDCEQSMKQSIDTGSEQQIMKQSINNDNEQIMKQRITNDSEQIMKQSITGTREVEKKIHKSRSENMLCVSQYEQPSRELRRSATVVRRRNGDDMSSEEFRQTIEDFIARRQRLLREEEEFSADALYKTYSVTS